MSQTHFQLPGVPSFVNTTQPDVAGILKPPGCSFYKPLNAGKPTISASNRREARLQVAPHFWNARCPVFKNHSQAPSSKSPVVTKCARRKRAKLKWKHGGQTRMYKKVQAAKMDRSHELRGETLICYGQTPKTTFIACHFQSALTVKKRRAQTKQKILVNGKRQFGGRCGNCD